MPAVAEPPAQSGAVAPSSSGEIHVSSAGMSAKEGGPVIVPAAPAKPAAPAPSARESMGSSLAQKIKPGTTFDPNPEKPTPGAKTGAEKESEAAKSGEEAEPETGEAEDKTVTPPAKEGEKPKAKVNPWKLLEEHKAARTKIEAEVAELKKLVPNAEVRKQEMAELDQIRARNKELEDEIRYVNYTKSPEFKTKYQEPYEKAWSKAMSELKEITVQDANGQERAVTANDLLELVNAPLGKAREQANAMFGDFADDVMAHRKEIKNLFEAQATALEEAKTKGAEREKKLQDEFQAKSKLISEQVAETWTRANEAALKDEKYGKYFVPIEGDQEGNQRLAKGFELVDRAFKENPMDPKLSPEDRASIIKRHAAVRNRAAAHGRLVYQLSQKEARIAELEKELAQYKSSTPETSGGQPAKPANGTMSAREQMEADLARRIRPGSMVR